MKLRDICLGAFSVLRCLNTCTRSSDVSAFSPEITNQTRCVTVCTFNFSHISLTKSSKAYSSQGHRGIRLLSDLVVVVVVFFFEGNVFFLRYPSPFVKKLREVVGK